MVAREICADRIHDLAFVVVVVVDIYNVRDQ